MTHFGGDTFPGGGILTGVSLRCGHLFMENKFWVEYFYGKDTCVMGGSVFFWEGHLCYERFSFFLGRTLVLWEVQLFVYVWFG